MTYVKHQQRDALFSRFNKLLCGRLSWFIRQKRNCTALISRDAKKFARPFCYSSCVKQTAVSYRKHVSSLDDLQRKMHTAGMTRSFYATG